jgi:hypothetical protein
MRRLQNLAVAKKYRIAAALLVLTIAVLVPTRALAPARAKAHDMPRPVSVGTSFSPRHAEELGLDYQDAFKRLEALHFRVIRISAYWDEIDDQGYSRLDWLVGEAAASHQPIVISVGMKGLGWPEFYIPPGYQPKTLGSGQDVAGDAALLEPTLLFVRDTVARYRQNPIVVAWQVENEPFNRAGPSRWWIGPEFLQQEIGAVRELDDRPLIVNVFSHFNMLFDQASSRQGLDFKRLLGFDGDTAERDSLSLLDSGDVLGLDAYTGIGYSFLGQQHVSHANSDWDDQLGRWREIARQQHKHAWITEAQAEPWEASPATYANPRSITPAQIGAEFHDLKDAGFSTVLLWGSEYWLWRENNGDSRWMTEVEKILQEESRGPSIQVALAEA